MSMPALSSDEIIVVLATMAKLLLVAFALGIAGYTKAFNELVYNYETQVMSGLPVGSKVYSGLKLYTTVHFQMVGEFEAKMQFRKPRLFWMNAPVNTNDPTREMVPMETFTELLDNDAVNMKGFLIQPVSFSYVRGQVENVKTAGQDPEWSVNIKKGFLSLMELNFNERQSLDPQVEVRKSDFRQSVYRVFEPSLTGECETTYRTYVNPGVEGTNNMKMEKVRNFENCKERIMFTADMLKGRPCEYCNADAALDSFTAQSMVRYEILGSPDNYTIVSAVGESMYAFVPFTEPRGRLMTFTNQTMTLVETKPAIDQEIQEPSSPRKHIRPLRAVKAPRDDKTRMKPYLLEKPERDELVHKAKKVLTGIAKINDKKVDITSDDFIKEMWRLFREMDQQGLTEVMEEAMKKTSLPKKAWKTMIDILPTVGTFESFDVLLNWLETNQPETDTALMTYMAISVIPEPDLLTVNRYIEHIKKYQMEPTNRYLWTTSWLTLGSFGLKATKWNQIVLKDLQDEIQLLTAKKEESNIMGVHQTMERRIEELRNQVSQVEKLYGSVKQEMITMVEDLYKTEKKEYKILALKVISNMGFEHFLPFLEKLAVDKTENIVIRQEAMDCMMRHIRERVNVERVRRNLLPVYFDYTEPEEVRLTAFFTVIMAFPSKPEMEMIAKSLHEEPSRNVGSFVWDTLVAFSNTTNTCSCIKSLAHNTTLALRYARKPEESFRYSSFYVNRYYNEVRKQGFTTTSGLWFSPKERLPTTFASCTQVTTYGRTFWLTGFEFRGRGMDAIYESFYKSPKFGALKKMLSPKFKRSVSESEEYMDDIMNKINVQPRNPVIPEGTLEFHFLDQTVFYIDIEPFLELDHATLSKESPESKISILQSKVLKAIPKVADVMSVLNRFFNTERAFYLPFIRTVMPTEMGLPLRMTYDWLGAFRMEGQMTNKHNAPRDADNSLYRMFNYMFNFKPSGFLETQINMMVDMKYYLSGTTTRIRSYMNTPVTMNVDGDLAKPKLHMKMTDMTPEMPMSYEAYSETFFYWTPFHAAEYPKPINIREILATTNSHMEVYSYDFGKDIFGFKYTISGHWTRPKSYNVEQYPMCGKKTMYIKFDPMVSKELEINFQHVREFVRDGAQIAEQENWLSDMFSSLFSSKDKNNAPQEDYEREPAAREPHEPFINLGEKDLTVQYLKRNFENDTKMLSSGLKCGFTITITRPGQTPGYKTQFTTLYQMDFKALNFYYTMDLNHFTPEKPQQPWRMVSTMKMTLPSTVIEPSSLQDNEYQRQVEEQINREVQRNERDLADGFDFNYYIMVNSVKQFMLSEVRDHRQVGIHDLINHVLEQSVSSQLQEVESLVQDQRRIERDAKVLRDRPVDLQRVDGMVDDLERMCERSEKVFEKVERIFAAIQSPEKPEESVMVQYLLISQTNTLNELGRFMKKVKVVVSPQRYSDISSRFDTLRQKLYKATKDQLKLSLEKQPIEKQRAGMDIEPSQVNIHTKLIDLERKLTDVLDKTVQPRWSAYESKPIEPVSDLKQICASGKEILSDVNSQLERDPKIDKMVRVKLAEVLLQLTQMVQIINIRLAQITPTVVQGPAPLAAPQALTEQENLQDIKQQFNSLVEAYASRVLLAANVEKESKYLLSSMSPEMQETIRTLNGITIRQRQVVEMLNTPPADRLNSQRIQEMVGKVIQVNTDLKNVIRKEIFSPSTILKLNPVVIKCGRELTKQLEIYERVCNQLDEKVQVEAANNRNLDSIETLRMRVWEAMDDTYKLINQAFIEFKKQPSHESLRMLRENGQSGSPSLSSLVKQAVALDAQHLHLKTEIGKLMRALANKPNPNDVYPRPAHPSQQHIELKEQLYKTVQSISQLQQRSEEMGRTLTSELSKRPASESLQELHATFAKRLDTLENDINSIENTLKDKASRDTALLPPLQSLQQVKDRLQRYQHTYKIEKSLIPNRSQQPQKSGQLADKPQQPWNEDPRSPRDLMSQINAVFTVHFGPDGGPKKTIVLKLVGSKTLQQLMWERDQIQPSKQAPIVKRYLLDKTLPNDKTAMGYRHIKSELNTYRHMRFFCTYEETLPFPVKNYMYKFHQIFKFYWYNEARVSLPKTEVSPANQFEVVMDFDKNEQWMSMLLNTNYEVMNIDFLPVPYWFRTLVFPPTMRHKENIITRLVGDATGTCSIIPRRIKTFDGERIMPELESKPCESVVAMDCSPNHEFVVTKTPISAGPQKVTILTREHKIDIERDIKTDEVVAKVNQEPLDFSKTPIKIEASASPILISKDRRGRVMVLVPQIGIYVDSDGERADIRVSRYHKGKLCGLCGDMNGRPQNDLTGPGKVLYPEPRSMASTYMIHSNKCDAKGIQRELRVPELKESSSRVQPLTKTTVLETVKDGGSVTCFSTTPVKTCPPQSEPQQVSSRTVNFHCLRPGRHVTKLKQDAQLRVLHEMEGASPDHSARVMEPSYCRRV